MEQVMTDKQIAAVKDQLRTEFNLKLDSTQREIKDSRVSINAAALKIEKATQEIVAIRTELGHHPTEIEVNDRIMEAQDKHLQIYHDITGHTETPRRVPVAPETPEPKKSGILRIDISGLSPLWQRVLFVGGTILTGALGWFGGKL